jgi:signal transduction histidine kinase
MMLFPTRTHALRYVAKIVIVTAFYFGAAQIGFLLTALHGVVSLFWPPSGIALAILLRFGGDLWPGIALGAFLVNAAQGQALGFLVAAACGNTLEAFLGVYLLRRYVGFHIALDRTVDGLGLILLAAGLSTMVSATIGVFGLCLTGRAAWTEYGNLWVVWWLGDAVGILGWTPVLLTWSAKLVIKFSMRQAIELTAWLVLLLTIGVITFQGRLIQSDFSLAFLPFPVLMWAALRLGQRAAVTGSLLITGLAVLRILTEPGPFPTQSVTENLIILWLYIGITAGTALLLAATVVERREGETRIARLNAELQSRAADLEAANKELDAYNASISHDLRGPLSNILSLTTVILEKDLSQMQPSVVELLRHTQVSARQMERLVRDLLAFSRTGHQPLYKEPVIPSDLVREVLRELGNPYNGRSNGTLELVIGDLPPCEADPNLLKQVYTNLLSNALKFTRQRDTKRIEIGFLPNHDKGAYFVRDNGVGFDMKRSQRLFTPFQRLHSDPQYEGSGIGLSLVKRIVERHGGHIWVEASPDNGATFFFTLG